MEEIFKDSQLESIERNISETIARVVERGFDNVDESVEDYSQLIERAEHRNLIILQLYENYFPPQRHEFELQVISDIVNAVIHSKTAIFISGAAASVPITNITSYVLKRTLTTVVNAFKASKTEKEKFDCLLKDVKIIEEYFKTNSRDEVNRISQNTGIEKERLIPLLKLLGYKKHKEEDKKYWSR